jgi:hypothetical protein
MAQSKAKGGAPAPVIEGARWMYVIAGAGDTPIKIMCNLNCEVQIILGHVKTAVLKGMAAKVAEENVKLKEGALDETETNDCKTLVDKLVELRAALESVSVEGLDLMDSTGALQQCHAVTYA